MSSSGSGFPEPPKSNSLDLNVKHCANPIVCPPESNETGYFSCFLSTHILLNAGLAFAFIVSYQFVHQELRSF